MSFTPRRNSVAITLGLLLFVVLAAVAVTNDSFMAAIRRKAAPEQLLTTKLPVVGGYNGRLYLASERIGMNPLAEDLIPLMKRNGVQNAVVYFSVREAQGVTGKELQEEDTERIESLLREYPGHLTPFLSIGKSGSEEAPLVGDSLAALYSESFTVAQENLGKDIIKGMGELETYKWGIRPNEANATKLFNVASSKGLAVKFHPLTGEMPQVETVLKKYPETTFLIHLSPKDYAKEQTRIIRLMDKYQNLYVTIDADHLMFDKDIEKGLLTKFEDAEPKTGAIAFTQDYDRNAEVLMEGAINRYKLIMETHPDRLMVGTDMHFDYAFDPDVYTRTIQFLRLFIAKAPKEHQEAIAYGNALRVFGEGVRVNE